MAPTRTTFFARWASQRLGIPAEQLTLAKLEQLPVPVDLPEGPGSELGGETQSVLDHPTESELLELAELGEQVLSELPELPDGYQPPPAEPAAVPRP
jgi:hypothetical protein